MIKQLIRFFVVLVFSIFCFPVIASAQMPDRTPEKFNAKEWAEYSRKVLHKVDPDDAELIDNLRIIVTKRDTDYATSYWWLHPQVLVVYFRVIKLVDSEDQLASVLLHELSHIKSKDFPPIEINDNGEAVIDYALRFQQERAADLFAHQKMVVAGCDPCATYTFARKTLILDPVSPGEPEGIVFLKRVGFMLADCKESAPQIPSKADPNPK